MKQKYACTEFTLKLIALAFMVLDHVHTYLGVGPEWISLLPRFVAPLFVYFLVEGFFHTHNLEEVFPKSIYICYDYAGWKHVPKLYVPCSQSNNQ